MASDTIDLTSSKAWAGIIRWSSEKNIPGNYSDVYVYAGMWKTEGRLTSSNSPTSGTITINGESYPLIGHYEFKDEVCIYEGTVRVYHNDDGKKTIAISLSCNGQPSTSLSGFTLSGSGYAELDQIERTSTLSAENGTLGAAQTLTINKASDSLRHTITYECGDLSGTIVSKTSESSVKWTPPLSLAEVNTTGTSVTANLTLTTYSGSTAIGTHSISVSYTIGSEVAPKITAVNFADVAGYKDRYGDYLQLRSKLNIKVTPTTYYGATIDSCKITVQGETFTELEATASEINAFGNIQVYVQIQDSRGKTAENYFSVYFREYSPPVVSSLTVKRCNSDGTENDQGEYVEVKYTASAFSLDDLNTGNALNTVSYKLEYKKTSEETFTTVELTEFTNNFYISSKTYRFKADTGSSYDVQLTVTDAFCSITKPTIASTAATIMHFKANGKGIGLGKVSEVDDAVDVGWDMQMNNHRVTNVAEPEEDSDVVTKKFLEEALKKLSPFPVGAIYLSVNPISPENLFGGKWEQIMDRFLLAAGNTYKGGATGGEATHTLTVEEMPSHTHNAYAPALDTPMYPGTDWNLTPVLYAPNGSNNAIIRETGGNQPHNNMPPYLCVYIWKRVA